MPMPDALPKLETDLAPLPHGWRWARLEDLCKQSREIVEPDSSRAQQLPYLSLEHIESETGRILRQAEDGFTDDVQSVTFAFDTRHVLYGKLRPYLNKVALPDFAGRCTTELIPLKPVGCDRDFLAWLMRRKETVEAAMREKTGSRMPRTDMEDLMQMRIPLPPLPEQKRIAAILTEQMALVEQARVAAEAQFQAAQDLPTAFLRTVFDSKEAQAWPQKCISDISLLVMDGPHITPTYVSEGVPFLTVRNIVNRTIDLTDVKYISEADYLEFSRRATAERGDILYTKDGTLGIPCLVKTDLKFSFFVSVALIKPDNEQVNSEYLAYALESSDALAQVELLGAGAGLKHMVLKSIRALRLPIPDLKTQNNIAKLLAEQINGGKGLGAKLEIQIDNMNALPAALLTQAFAGRL